jgi:drug/metabolite transporter (DMT)-like permease
VNEDARIGKFDVSATLACAGTLAFWSLGPIFIKYLTGSLDSWTQNLLRYSAACLFWLPFLLLSIKNKRFDTRTWRKAALPAALNVTMQSLWAVGFYYIGPAFMALLGKTTIIWIVGFSFVLFPDERALVKSKRFWLGLALSATGVVGVICFKKDFAVTGTLTGIVMALTSAFMWGAYTVSARSAFRDIDSRNGFSVMSIYTVAGLCVLALLFGRVGDCVSMDIKSWAVVVFSGVTCIGLAHVLYYAAMRRIGATIPALVVLVQPFAVFAVSRVVFEESLNVLQLVFGLVLLAGSAFAIWSQQHLKCDS